MTDSNSQRSGGKRRMFGGGTSASSGIASALTPSMSDPEGGYEMIALDRIQPDPENPRHLGLDPTNPAQVSEDDPERERKLAALEHIQDLAVSIKSVGLNQPITVYRHGTVFRIATGERRYLAHRLIDRPTIKTIILKERPAQLRLLQWVENFQRQDLPLWDKVENLRSVIEEASELGRGVDSADNIRELTGLKRSQAFEYLAVLRGPQDVLDAVKRGALSSVASAAEISRITDPVSRSRAIKEVEAGGKPTPAVKPKAAPERKPKPAGRPKTVKLGTTAHTDIVRLIMEKVAPKKYTPDWTDPVAVTKAFQQMLRDLEQQQQ